MSETEVQYGIELIQNHGAERNFAGPAPEEAIRTAQGKLGITFPRSLEKFLRRLGAGQLNTERFFGLADDRPEYDIVEQTLRMRRESNLDDHYIVVHAQGDTSVTALDLTPRKSGDTGRVLVVPRSYGNIEEPNYIADDFGEFFLDRVRAQLEQERSPGLH